ncbi:hypothetical protein [Bizionia myxarmorum]|uniref:Uncharacterized protein n=1 Tax=Bizionia myxarmorum TaxID=291186 RepID=A0A5D0RD15_9FLAO|nr:hypothetical protein [Bizionia myxarmorum]TYB78608.1 hypothetical protein ES674_02175 [Bizionia myxarmorum]
MTLTNTILAIGPFQIILIVVMLIALLVFPFLLIFYKRNDPEHNLPIWIKIVLVIPSFTWVGILTSLYILFRKKDFNSVKAYKFSKSTRNYAIFLFVMSLAFSIFHLVRMQSK